MNLKHCLLLLIAALVLAPSALAENGVQGKSPAQFCKNELAALGLANFKSLYAPGGTGANAMGKCVSKHARAAAANRTNAAKTCKAEMAIPEAEFRAAHGGMSFAEFYADLLGVVLRQMAAMVRRSVRVVEPHVVG